MAKRTLPDFAQTVSVVDQFLKEFQAETDRGTVLIAGAYLDDLLASLLRAFFVDDPKIVNGLITIDGPLGTFATRIDLTYCLGLIRSDQHEDFHTCRKIRNLCAHSHKRISFDEQPIIDLCRNLKQIQIIEQLRDQMSPAEQELLIDRFKTNRQTFVGNIVHLAMGLMVRGVQLKHRIVGKGFEEDSNVKLPFESNGV